MEEIMTKLRFFSASILAATALLATHASARTISAAGGRAYNGADASCFQDFDTGMTNKCGSSKWFEMAVVWDSAGNKTLRVDGTDGLTCAYVEIGKNGVQVTPPGTGIPLPTGTVVAITVGGGNYGKVQCFVQANKSIYGIDYFAP
jgi:hypothetical protein